MHISGYKSCSKRPPSKKVSGIGKQMLLSEHPTVVKVEVEKMTSLLKFTNFENMIRKAILGNTRDDALNPTQRDYEQIERIFSFHDYLHIEESCIEPSKTTSLLYMNSIV